MQLVTISALIGALSLFSRCTAFMPGTKITTSPARCDSTLDDKKDSTLGMASPRRDFLKSASASAAALAFGFSVNPAPATAQYTGKVLVLGKGFVGTEVCNQLESLGIEFTATTRDGRDGTIALDLISQEKGPTSEIETLAKGYSAVISCIGSIGTPNDEAVNAATGLAAIGAKAAGVKNFVYISVAPEVRDAAKGIAFVEKYMDGKAFSEEAIKSNFPEGYTLIEPTFIYGGDKFAVNPPRVADGYGKLVEGILSSGPFRFAASVSPGMIGVALEPPVKVKSVARAAIAGAVGVSQPVLDTYDKIKEASKLI